MAQQQGLLRLRTHFAGEKMGQWPERVALFLAASRLLLNACVVEIGSWVGVGTCYLACGLRSGGGGRVYAVDTYRGSTLDAKSRTAWAASVAKMGGSSLPLFRKHIAAFGLEALVVPIEADSVRASAEWAGPTIDLLFIDGDHVYEAVRADFEAWWPRVKPAGVVMFHDYDDRHPGVKRLVDEMRAGPLKGDSTEQVGCLLTTHLHRVESLEPGAESQKLIAEG
jgi:predicted O-methyltransferase YrrM